MNRYSKIRHFMMRALDINIMSKLQAMRNTFSQLIMKPKSMELIGAIQVSLRPHHHITGTLTLIFSPVTMHGILILKTTFRIKDFYPTRTRTHNTIIVLCSHQLWVEEVPGAMDGRIESGRGIKWEEEEAFAIRNLKSIRDGTKRVAAVVAKVKVKTKGKNSIISMPIGLKIKNTNLLVTRIWLKFSIKYKA